MAYKGVDPNFVGPTYQAPMVLQDAENAINWFCEIAEVDGAKEAIALLGTPGLNTLYTFANGASVRGFWVLPGNTQALAVCGNTLYVVSIATAATSSAGPTFTASAVGTLLTSSGPVCIRDNGALFGGEGGFAVIVDGANGYYYVLSGTATTASFTASVTYNSNTITLSGTTPNGMVIAQNAVLTDSQFVIPTGTYLTAYNSSAPSFTMSAPATASAVTDIITLHIPVFGQITDPGFLGASRVAFIEGWLIFNQPGSRTFFTTGPTPYTLLFPGLWYALKDSSTDNLVTLFENDRELWLVGERTSEVWYNAGNSNGVSFSRVPAVGPQIGCAAQHSISRLGENLVWFAKNEQGENVVIRTQQYSFERISNHAVESIWASYPVTSDAIGFVYEEGGHVFYQLTFPTADATWVYDLTASSAMGKPMWHQRSSFSSATGLIHRHRANCYMDFADVRIVGDYATGQMYQLSRNYYTDAGNTIRRQRRSKPVWSQSDRKRMFHASLQVEFTPGVGLQTGQGSSPQAMLRWSDDGGFTWSNEHWQSIGAAGATKNRAKWNRLGRARDRIYEVNFTDPVPSDIIGATLFLEPEEET